jgi:CheY-like chemotaxis protein
MPDRGSVLKEGAIKHILLIDDEPNYCFVMKTRLEDTGKYRVTLSNDGDDGIAKARELSPDLILLDLMMPKKSGFDVAMDLKKKNETNSIPIVFLSGILKEDVIGKNKNIIGEGTYVSKTEDIDDLLDIIENTILRGADLKKETRKEKVRIVTYLPREHVDYLDKIGKDVLFAKGFKLSRSETLKQLVEFLQKMKVDIAKLDLINHDLSTALIKYCEDCEPNKEK